MSAIYTHCRGRAFVAPSPSNWLGDVIQLAAPGVASTARFALRGTVDSLPYLAPLFLIFEIWQLVISERYLGIKQIARGADPRELGLSEITAFFWSGGIFVYWTWMGLLLFSRFGRVHGLGLIIVSTIGFIIRRGAPLKWVLVVLTLEGAVRVGLLFSLCGMLWWHYHH